MGHRIGLPVGVKRDVADRQQFSQFQDAGFGDCISRRGFAQKIDVQIGRHGHRHGPQLTQDRRIHG